MIIKIYYKDGSMQTYYNIIRIEKQKTRIVMYAECLYIIPFSIVSKIIVDIGDL